MASKSSGRSGLKVIQASASSDNVMVGNARITTEATKKKKKHPFNVYADAVPSRPVKPKVTYCDKSVNTDDSFPNNIHITACDLTSEPGIGYWKELAEARKDALQSALAENEQLHEKVASLDATVQELLVEGNQYAELMHNASQLADMTQELINSQEVKKA